LLTTVKRYHGTVFLLQYRRRDVVIVDRLTKGPKGANTEEILLDLGYSDPQIRTFFKADVIE